MRLGGGAKDPWIDRLLQEREKQLGEIEIGQVVHRPGLFITLRRDDPFGEISPGIVP